MATAVTVEEEEEKKDVVDVVVTDMADVVVDRVADDGLAEDGSAQASEGNPDLSLAAPAPPPLHEALTPPCFLSLRHLLLGALEPATAVVAVATSTTLLLTLALPCGKPILPAPLDALLLFLLSPLFKGTSTPCDTLGSQVRLLGAATSRFAAPFVLPTA